MDKAGLISFLTRLGEIDVEDIVPILTSIYCDGRCQDTSKCKKCLVLNFIKNLRVLSEQSKSILKEVNENEI